MKSPPLEVRACPQAPSSGHKYPGEREGQRPSPFFKSNAPFRITRLSLWHVPLTSHEAYYMAGGKACETVETVVVALDTDDGRTGWGECCPIPHYLPAYARGIAPAFEELAPVILGTDPVGPEALGAAADAWLPGHVYAKSAPWISRPGI